VLSKLANVDDLADPRLRSPILEREGRLDLAVLPPDELPGRELVEVGLERDRMMGPVRSNTARSLAGPLQSETPATMTPMHSTRPAVAGP
jgi:hypothetical protein